MYSFYFILFIVFVIIIALLCYSYYNYDIDNQIDSSNNVEPELSKLLSMNCNYHRILLIETIQNTENEAPMNASIKDMLRISKKIGKCLNNYFDISTVNRLSSLFHEYNLHLYKFYKYLKNTKYEHGNFYVIGKKDDTKFKPLVDVLPLNVKDEDDENSDENSEQICIRKTEQDLVSETIIDIEIISRKISSSIHEFFERNNIEKSSLRLENLINMYHKELMYQASSYVSKKYNSSIFFSKNAMQASEYIAEELSLLCTKS